jgi:hypothetical protein
MKAYYFANKDKKLRYGDDRKIVVGETHSVSLDDKPLELCDWGLHASIKALDAIDYAPDNMLYVVELSGEIIIGEDKVCAEHRKYLYEIDAEELLREFARKQALINIEKVYPYVTETKKENMLVFLEGRDLSESARTAAESAAKSAISAIWSAAESAKPATSSTIWSASWAAKSAAWAAKSTIWSATWAAKSAIWSAESVESTAKSAESAAKSARNTANEMLENMIKQEIK